MTLKRNVRGGVPSPYPRILFHSFRAAQLLGSLVVSGIMTYFMYHLRDENIPVPWTFILLFSVSLATIAALAVTIFFYNFTYLSPRFNIILNGSIAILWALGFALLSWSISNSHVLTKQCTYQVWGVKEAAAICRDYKALWAMTLCGTVSTFLAFGLDLNVQHKVTRLGNYNKPEDDKDAQMVEEKKSGRVTVQGYDAPQEQGDRDWHHELDEDVAYHSPYAEQPHGPLDGKEPIREI